MGAKANLLIDQGADFSTSVTVTNNDGSLTNLVGYTAAGQIRKHYTSTTAINFVITFSSPRTLGVVNLTLTSTTTGTMEAGRYVYDVELTDANGGISRLVEGIATVTPQVTKT